MSTHITRIAVTAALLVSVLAAPQAHAIDLDFGMTGGFEYHVSEGLPEVESKRLRSTGGPNIGLWFLPWLGTGLSYRFVELGDYPWDLNSHTVEASLRARFCLTEWMHVVTELGLELQVAALKADLGPRTAKQTAFAFGVQPRAGIEVSVPVEGTFDLRAGVMLGFAFRTGLSYSAMAVSSPTYDNYEGPDYSLKPVDMGSLNLSALTFGLTVGGRF